jgi:hypothetical protein
VKSESQVLALLGEVMGVLDLGEFSQGLNAPDTP